MDLFRGSLSAGPVSGVLTHFGTMLAAAHRLDSIYATTNIRGINREGGFTVFNSDYRALHKLNPAQALDDFASFMQKATIKKFNIDVKKPLHIQDCWDDDPIGSGALDIFQDNKRLTDCERGQLQSLFHPFRSTIYPQDISLLPPTKFNAMKQEWSKDPIFCNELEKRKQRSAAIGEPWSMVEPQEVIWTGLTIDLRDWALQNSYDAFVYQNTEEDVGSECCVTLKEDNIKGNAEKLVFDKDIFLQTVAPVFKDFLEQIRTQIPGAANMQGVYWAGTDPTQFWTAQQPA